MTEQQPSPVNRVVVALDSPLGNLELLETAGAVAARTGARLVVRFVEDSELIHAAALSFTREIDRVSGAERDWTVHRMQRVWRAQQVVLRRALARVAGTRKINTGLEVVHGPFLESVVMAKGEIMMLGRSSHAMSSAWATVPTRSRRSAAATLGAAAKPHSPVAVLFSNTELGVRALALAAELAHTLRAGLLVLLDAGHGPTAQHLEEQAESVIKDKDENTRLTFVLAPTLEHVNRWVSKKRCGLLVLSRDNAHLGDEASLATVTELPVPAVLV